MAKIVIEIDGKNASLKIDGKEVGNLSSFFADFCADCRGYDGTIQNALDFSYTVKNEENPEFPSRVSFYYVPATAAFTEGKYHVDTKNPTREDYGRM